MTDQICPSEEELYRLLAGDADVDIKKHVDTCDACRNQVRKLRSEATVLRHIGESSPNQADAPQQAKFPGVIGKFIIVGIWDDNPSFVTYQGLHAVVRQDVFIHTAKSPLCESEDYQTAFLAGCGRWMQPRRHVAPLLDAGEFESRPYVVMESNGGVRLDRLISQKQVESPTLIQIFGKIGRALAGENVPHPLFRSNSVIVDEADQPMLVDWAATAEFASTGDVDSNAAANFATRRFALAFCEAVLAEVPPPGPSQCAPLADALKAQHVPAEIAILMAKVASSLEAAPPSLSQIADALLQESPKPLWQRLFRR